MEYVTMTMEEAKKIVKKDAVVLVAKQDLQKEDCNIGFEKKKFYECSDILKEAAKICDDFVNQLRCFTVCQKNPINYAPKGTLNTILFRREE